MNGDQNTKNIKEQIEEILKKVAQIENVTNYKICTNIDSNKGDGYLGEFFKGSFIDLDTEKEYFVAIKKAPSESSMARSIIDLPKVYQIENHFYSKVFPALNAFQKSHKVQDEFKAIPYYYFGSPEQFNETVVMEDIIPDGFKLHPKELPVPAKNLKLIFKTYGKFHALSMAFKEQNLEKFNEITSCLPKYFSLAIESEGFSDRLISVFNRAINILDPVGHYHILEKLKPYCDNVMTLFIESANYCGDYSAIIHGDCWSNNMMHKYNENGEPIDMKLLDFQLNAVSNPIHDVAYFFYTGAGKNDLSKLDDYLDIYYESFTKFAKELGSDPNKLFPKHHLKPDWKKYGKMGFLIGLSAAAAKTIPKETVGNMALSKVGNAKIEIFQDVSDAGQMYFRENAIPLLQHAYEYGVI